MEGHAQRGIKQKCKCRRSRWQHAARSRALSRKDSRQARGEEEAQQEDNGGATHGRCIVHSYNMVIHVLSQEKPRVHVGWHCAARHSCQSCTHYLVSGGGQGAHLTLPNPATGCPASRGFTYSQLPRVSISSSAFWSGLYSYTLPRRLGGTSPQRPLGLAALHTQCGAQRTAFRRRSELHAPQLPLLLTLPSIQQSHAGGPPPKQEHLPGFAIGWGALMHAASWQGLYESQSCVDSQGV